MDRMSIAKLQKNTVMIHPDIISLFDIYVNHIRPSMNSHNIEMEQNRVFFRPTLFIKEKTVWSMVNNFELYYFLKSFKIDQTVFFVKIRPRRPHNRFVIQIFTHH